MWTDPPSSPAAFINLINDLNLVVTAEEKVTFGNEVYFGALGEQGYAV